MIASRTDGPLDWADGHVLATIPAHPRKRPPKCDVCEAFMQLMDGGYRCPWRWRGIGSCEWPYDHPRTSPPDVLRVAGGRPMPTG